MFKVEILNRDKTMTSVLWRGRLKQAARDYGVDRHTAS